MDIILLVIQIIMLLLTVTNLYRGVQQESPYCLAASTTRQHKLLISSRKSMDEKQTKVNFMAQKSQAWTTYHIQLLVVGLTEAFVGSGLYISMYCCPCSKRRGSYLVAIKTRSSNQLPIKLKRLMTI